MAKFSFDHVPTGQNGHDVPDAILLESKPIYFSNVAITIRRNFDARFLL